MGFGGRNVKPEPVPASRAVRRQDVACARGRQTERPPPGRESSRPMARGAPPCHGTLAQGPPPGGGRRPSPAWGPAPRTVGEKRYGTRRPTNPPCSPPAARRHPGIPCSDLLPVQSRTPPGWAGPSRQSTSRFAGQSIGAASEPADRSKSHPSTQTRGRSLGALSRQPIRPASTCSRSARRARPLRRAWLPRATAQWHRRARRIRLPDDDTL